ncbi:Uncharacterized protein TCM_000319 [Theobroma cacao]|uniref:Uncharacterized protein n=1 Tax=Theobroma cacao TaxID=3641 RepID=A0A061DG01_THECC|nr:Uncharacterized protein TCM_000319 [Theobroma cacao]
MIVVTDAMLQTQSKVAWWRRPILIEPHVFCCRSSPEDEQYLSLPSCQWLSFSPIINGQFGLRPFRTRPAMAAEDIEGGLPKSFSGQSPKQALCHSL